MSTPDVSVKSVWGVSALVPAHKSERGREKERWGNVVWVKGVWKLSLYSILLFWLLCPVIPHQTDLKSVPSLFLKLVQQGNSERNVNIWPCSSLQSLGQHTARLLSHLHIDSTKADSTWAHPPLLCKLPQRAFMLCLVINGGMSAMFPLWSDGNVIRWDN